MIVRLKNLHDASVRNIRSLGRYDKYDKFSDRNDAIMKRLFDELMNGKIKVVAFKDPAKKDFKCYHKSVKERGCVQLSSGFYKNGELYPTYDIQMPDFEKMRVAVLHRESHFKMSILDLDGIGTVFPVGMDKRKRDELSLGTRNITFK